MLRLLSRLLALRARVTRAVSIGLEAGPCVRLAGPSCVYLAYVSEPSSVVQTLAKTQ